MKTNQYDLTEQQEKEMWRNAIFVFDTSSLLNFYDYSDKTIDDIFNSTLEKLKDNLWIPYNVNFEYNKNRYKLINRSITLYNDLNKHVKTIIDSFQEIRNRTISKEKHPFIENNIFEEFEPFVNAFKNRVEAEIQKKIELIESTRVDDKICKKINDFFSVGISFKYSEIIEIIKEGEFRFKHKLPPGYKDENDKIGFQKFADLIIWKQIIEHAKGKNKPIILIMDDFKEDWWVLDKKRKPIKPREELIDEMLDVANTSFWMYSTSKFIETSKLIIESKITSDAIDEIKQVSTPQVEKTVEGIILSANREEDEPWRLLRLADVARYYKRYSEKINIIKLHDHKGYLTVIWSKEPTTLERHTIESAWENENEPGESTEHLIN